MASKGPTDAVFLSHERKPLRISQTVIQKGCNLPFGLFCERIKTLPDIYTAKPDLLVNGRNLSDVTDHPLARW
jgi:hypothetical protein